MTIIDLPFDMHYVIYNYLLFDDKIKIILLDMEFKELWNRDIKNATIIKKYLLKYCKIDDDYLNNPIQSTPSPIQNNNLTVYHDNYDKNKVYRYYIQKYPIDSLLNYPEFLTNKSISDVVKKNNCINWINNNLNKKRNRRDIYEFFKQNDITVKEIFNAGW